MSLENFTSVLRVIVRDLARQYPNDVVVARVQKRITLAASVNPGAVVEVVGGYLYRHRDLIYSDDGGAAFFLADARVGEAALAAPDVAHHLVPRLQQYARTLDAAGRQAYIDLVVELLDEYVEILAARAAAQQK